MASRPCAVSIARHEWIVLMAAVLYLNIAPLIAVGFGPVLSQQPLFRNHHAI